MPEILVLMLIMFIIGYFLGTEQVHIKKCLKRARRNSIIKYKNNICNELCDWEYRHPSKLLLITDGKQGSVSYKMAANRMSEEEFQMRIREKRSK